MRPINAALSLQASGFLATGIDLIDLDVKKPGTMLCAPGQYFPDHLSSCTVCDAGSYCLGGNFYKTKCANGTSPAGSTSHASCTCNEGFGGADGKCMLCSRNSCAAGSYTVGCGGTSAGSCQGCAPCVAGFFNDGCLRDTSGTCAACPAETFALGQVVCSACDEVCGEKTFALGCGGASQGSCQACGDCAGEQFRAGCTGISPGTCQACSDCAVGQFRAACTGISPGTCEACTTCEAGEYTTGCGGASQGSCQACGDCAREHFRKGCTGILPGTCQACGDCAGGQFRKGCTGVSPGTCQACGDCAIGQFRTGCTGISPGTCQACGDCAAGRFRKGCTGVSPGTCQACTSCEAGEYTAGCAGRSGPGGCETCLEVTYALEAGLRIDACLPCTECYDGMVLYDCTATTGPGTCKKCPDGQYTSGGRCVSCCPTLVNRKYETAAECLDMARVDVEGQGAGAVLSVPSVAGRTIVDGCVSGGVSYNAAWNETVAGVNGTTESQRSVAFTCSCAPTACPLGEFPTGGGECTSCCQDGKTHESCESLTASAKASLLFVGSWVGKVRAADPSGRF